MMSRSGYSEDYGDDFPGQLGLYRANVKRSINSQKGQARLRELRGVLEAMPVKTRAAGVFRRGAEACAAAGAAGAAAIGAFLPEGQGPDAMGARHAVPAFRAGLARGIAARKSSDVPDEV